METINKTINKTTNNITSKIIDEIILKKLFSKADEIFKDNQYSFLNVLSDFLKIPSISLDASYRAECDACANKFSDYLIKWALKANL